MPRIIRKVEAIAPAAPALKKVAAYARVSSGKDAMLHSLSAQVSYYNDYIQQQPGWVFAGVYADEALTGTKDTRADFQRLLGDCRQGKVHMVLTKSISRFARNTVTLLETVRELKNMGVDVYFEEQNIHTMSADGELMLTILASYAQEEARSASENQLWRVKRNFESGKPWNCTMLGYRYDGSQLQIVPEEAEIVRRVFRLYQDGFGTQVIAKHLNRDGLLTRQGKPWIRNSVVLVLKNYAYTGNLVLQRTYNENYITKRKMQNDGQLPQYHATDTHEAIIDLDTFLAVQMEMERRAKAYTKTGTTRVYPFSKKLICGICGQPHRRKVSHGIAKWVCPTFSNWGKDTCPAKAVPEYILLPLAIELTGSEESIQDGIDYIEVHPGNRLVFHLADGRTAERIWKDRSRADSWTPEMKEAARQKDLERRMANGIGNRHSGNKA